MYVYMYVCMYLCIHEGMYIYVHIYTCMDINICMYVHIYMYGRKVTYGQQYYHQYKNINPFILIYLYVNNYIS
jgi:hypothetical protein